MVLMPLKPYTAEENEEMTSIEYIRKGMAELPVRIQMGGSQTANPYTTELGLGIWPDARVHV
jgi:hypothetical protein